MALKASVSGNELVIPLGLATVDPETGTLNFLDGVSVDLETGQLVFQEGEAPNRRVLAEDSVSVAYVNTSAYTNLIRWVEGLGLVVGSMENGALGFNTLQDADGFHVRNGSAALASFLANLIRLGIGSPGALITLCDDVGRIMAETDTEGNDFGRLLLQAAQIRMLGKHASVESSTEEWDEADPYLAPAYSSVYASTSAEEGNQAYAGMSATDESTRKDARMTVAAAGEEPAAYVSLSHLDAFAQVAFLVSKTLFPHNVHVSDGMGADPMVWLGVGSGGVNHGVYSPKTGRWIVRADADGNVYTRDDIPLSQTQSANCTFITSGTPAFYRYDSDVPAKAYRHGNVVTVTGAGKNGAAATFGTATTHMFTVPEGYRPPRKVRQLCVGGNHHKWLLTIDADGKGYISRYGTATAAVECAAGTWLPFTVTYVIE